MGPLVDTSVLVEYFRGVINRETDLLDALLADGIAPATAPVIVQEFLQGFRRTPDVETATEHLSLFTRLDPPGYDTHERAAAAHHTLKRRGFTAPTVDGLIVQMAYDARCALLTRDDNQKRLARAIDVDLA
jgi:predicted nucleic acid-binding protein